MSKIATNPLDPLGWFPKLATPAPSTPSVVPTTVTVDFGGKLDAIQQGIENTNALLTTLIDQLAGQQQIQPIQPTLQRAPVETISHRIYRSPFYMYNRNTDRGYEIVRANNTSTVFPIGATTVFTATQTSPPGGAASMMRYVRYIGEWNLPLGVLSIHLDFNGQSLIEDDLAFNAPIPSRCFVMPGIQQFDFITANGDFILPSIDLSFGVTLRVVITNTDGAAHNVQISFGTWLLQEILDQDRLAKLKAEVDV